MKLVKVSNSPLFFPTKGHGIVKKNISIGISPFLMGLRDCCTAALLLFIAATARSSNAVSGLVIWRRQRWRNPENFSREAKEGNCVAQLEIAGDRRKNGPEKGGGGGGRRVRESWNKSGERERNGDAAPRLFNPNLANPVFQPKERGDACWNNHLMKVASLCVVTIII